MIDQNTRCIEGPGPVSYDEFPALVEKIAGLRTAYIHRQGRSPNAIILSNRQWYAMRKFAPMGDIDLYHRGLSFRGMSVIVDGRGDYPNTPRVGFIEF